MKLMTVEKVQSAHSLTYLELVVSLQRLVKCISCRTVVSKAVSRACVGATPRRLKNGSILKEASVSTRYTRHTIPQQDHRFYRKSRTLPPFKFFYQITNYLVLAQYPQRTNVFDVQYTVQYVEKQLEWNHLLSPYLP